LAKEIIRPINSLIIRTSNVILYLLGVLDSGMIRTLKHLVIVILAIMLSIMWSKVAFAKDIRDQVIKETSLDEEVVLFCLQHCQGNERKGYLKSISVNRMNTGYYHVAGKTALQNRQVIRGPFEFVLYDHTVIVNAFGTLNPDNCELRIDKVLVENDFYDIFNSLLQNQADVIGRVERIPNCRRFLE